VSAEKTPISFEFSKAQRVAMVRLGMDRLVWKERESVWYAMVLTLAETKERERNDGGNWLGTFERTTSTKTKKEIPRSTMTDRWLVDGEAVWVASFPLAEEDRLTIDRNIVVEVGRTEGRIFEGVSFLSHESSLLSG
jgi:hypothetical protein